MKKIKHENVHACSCAHAFQDKRYGKGRRLFNPDAKGGKGKCTVCGRAK